MESLRVVVNARPLLPDETVSHAQSCLSYTEAPPSLTLRRQPADATFSAFDAVYSGPSARHLYPKHVAPLVASLFDGINATVFAYGQTAAGKTYTMSDVTAQAARQVFSLSAQARAQSRNVTVRVGFVEIYKEHIRDLVDGARAPLGAVTVNVRERVTKTGRVVFLDGARECCVGDEHELMAIIREGALVRRTAATGMNASSSRSHSVITITVQQEKDDTCLAAKLHLVDLAGSERAKRTRVTGERFAEGVDINRGLFALAKVISALADRAKGGKGHIPYRDSKLTRLLQDSLGGNARTLLIACISPADSSREETLGTLRYAERAKSIRNKPTVNTEPDSVEISNLRSALARARAQISALAAENERLRLRQALRSNAAANGPVSPIKKVAPGVTSNHSSNSALQFRIAELEGLLAEQSRGQMANTIVPPAILPSGTENILPRKARRPRRRARLLAKDIDANKMNTHTADGNVLQIAGNTKVREDSTWTSSQQSSESTSESHSGDEVEKHIEDVVSASRLDVMRRTFTDRLQQAEEDKQSIDKERIKLLRRISSIEKKHLRVLEEMKLAHLEKMRELRNKLPETKRVEAEISRQVKQRDMAEAASKRLKERLSTTEKARDDAETRLAEAMLREQKVRRKTVRENREVAKSEKALRGELRRLETVRGRLEAAVNRLRMENEGMRTRLREAGGRRMRRTNSAFARPMSRS